jgi:hypothetical protein
LNDGIKISMDGHGRVYDNIFVKRLWRTVKYEEVYLHDYRTVSEARSLLSIYFHFYNTERLHETLGYVIPYEVYYDKERNVSMKMRHQTKLARECSPLTNIDTFDNILVKLCLIPISPRWE